MQSVVTYFRIVLLVWNFFLEGLQKSLENVVTIIDFPIHVTMLVSPKYMAGTLTLSQPAR
jgi:hypothetical protein